MSSQGYNLVPGTSLATPETLDESASGVSEINEIETIYTPRNSG